MKSLEIIDDLLFDFLDDAIDESATVISKGELEQIKQDLEVLEILTKSYIGLSIIPARNEWLWKLDFENYITKKDAMKVKQWLEEN